MMREYRQKVKTFCQIDEHFVKLTIVYSCKLNNYVICHKLTSSFIVLQLHLFPNYNVWGFCRMGKTRSSTKAKSPNFNFHVFSSDVIQLAWRAFQNLDSFQCNFYIKKGQNKLSGILSTKIIRTNHHLIIKVCCRILAIAYNSHMNSFGNYM